MPRISAGKYKNRYELAYPAMLFVATRIFHNRFTVKDVIYKS